MCVGLSFFLQVLVPERHGEAAVEGLFLCGESLTTKLSAGAMASCAIGAVENGTIILRTKMICVRGVEAGKF